MVAKTEEKRDLVMALRHLRLACLSISNARGAGERQGSIKGHIQVMDTEFN